MVKKEEQESGMDLETPGGFKAHFDPALARLVLVLLVAGATVWYAGYSMPQRILRELKGMRQDIVSTKIAADAIVEALPEAQQKKAKKIIDDRLAVLKYAEAHQ